MPDLKTLLSRSNSVFILVDQLGQISWVNHDLFNLAAHHLLEKGIGYLDIFLNQADRRLQAQEIESVMLGQGNLRTWQVTLNLPDLGKKRIHCRGWLIDQNIIAIEIDDASSLDLAESRLEQINQELDLVSRMLKLRGRNLPEDQFYYLLMRLVIREIKASEALLYIKPDQLNNQLIASVTAEKSRLDLSRYDLSIRFSRLRTELIQITKQQQGLLNKLYRSGYRSAVSLPLLNNKEFVGCLILLSEQVDLFDWRMIRLLNRVGSFLVQLVNLDILRWQREHSENISAAIFSNVQDGLVVIDQQAKINEANPPAARMLNISSSSKKPLLADLVIPGYQETINRFINRLFAKGVAKAQIKIHPDIERIYEIRGTRIAGDHKRLYLCNITDVSEWVNRQELLHQKTVKLEQLDQVKNQFISMVSHELRSPLTVLQGHLSLWRGDKQNIDQESMEAMILGVERLNRLVDDILLATQMEYSELPLVYNRVALVPYLEKIVAQLKPLLRAKNLTLISKVSRISVQIDGERLEQVIVNIIMNAIKYCAVGEMIIVKVSRTSVGINISIADTGPGIDRGHLPHIFDRFYKVNYSSGGAGLGLYIAAQLVRRMGGKIRVQSKPGQGTKFIINLPVEINSQPD